MVRYKKHSFLEQWFPAGIRITNAFKAIHKSVTLALNIEISKVNCLMVCEWIQLHVRHMSHMGKTHKHEVSRLESRTVTPGRGTDYAPQTETLLEAKSSYCIPDACK